MTIKICDVCHSTGEMKESMWRVGFKNSLKIDLCVKHKDFAKGKSQKEFGVAYFSIMGIGQDNRPTKETQC